MIATNSAARLCARETNSNALAVRTQLANSTGPVRNLATIQPLENPAVAVSSVATNISAPAIPTGSRNSGYTAGHATPNVPSGRPRLMNPR